MPVSPDAAPAPTAPPRRRSGEAVPRAPHRRRRHHRVRPPGARPPLVLLVPAGLAAVVALLPLGYLVVRALEQGAGAAWDVLWTERTLHLALRSLWLTVVVTGVAVVLGTTVAWLTTRAALPGRTTWAAVAALPLAVPTYVAAYAWVASVPRIPPFAGSVLVLSVCTYPYVLLPVAAALRRTDPALEEVARSLGRGRLRTVLGVTLRPARPAMAAGGLLVALYVLSDFGAVSLLRYDSFTRIIYTSYRSSFDRTPAAVLACVLVAITLLIVWGESRSRGRTEQARVGTGAARRHGPVDLGRWRWAAVAGLGLLTAVSIGFPVVSLGVWLARGSSGEIDVPRVAAAAGATVVVAALGALLTIALAVPVGVVAARYRARWARALEQATYAGHALPGIVVALALVFLAVRYAYPIYQRTPVLVLAYAVLFLPAAVGAVRSSVAMSPPSLEEVARSLGHRPLQVLRRVTLPLAAPGVAAGTVLVFLTAMKELPATLLLRPTGMDTLATELWTRTGVGQYAAAAPYAALLVVLAAVPTYLLGRASPTLGTGGSS